MEKKAELIFMPLPVAGHLLSTVEFAKRLLKHDRRIHTITILTWKLPFAPNVGSYARSLVATHPSLRLIELPDIEDPPPMDLFKTSPEAYIHDFVDKTKPFVRKTILDILASSPVRVAAVVVDFFCVHLIGVAKEVGLPSYIFLTSNFGFLSMMKFFPERHRSNGLEFNKKAGDEEMMIPGITHPVPVKVMPPGAFDKAAYLAFVKLGERFVDANGILVNTFAELEPYCSRYFSDLQNYPPVYPVGPVLNLEDRPNTDLDPAQQAEIMKWLDEQDVSSVVFLCFGSMGIFGAEQVREIANGLELAGYKFLWSIRTNPLEKKEPHDLLPEGFVDRVTGRGMVCGWAPQVEVLAHKAVGGFVSHCGWNSILESLWYGVPIVTWPMYAEQQLNAFVMVKELGLAVEMRLDYVSSENELVNAGEIARAIQRLMEEDNVVRKKVKEMSEAARKALTDGGSSFTALEKFMHDVIGSSNF